MRNALVLLFRTTQSLFTRDDATSIARCSNSYDSLSMYSRATDRPVR